MSSTANDAAVDDRAVDENRINGPAANGTAANGRGVNGTGVGGASRPVVEVTVPAATLTGAFNAPGELAGYGAIPASMAREIAADGTWRRLLTDPASGALLDYGRTRYEPSQALADYVRARDRTCRFPGCRRAARGCDLDHTVPYPNGPTDAGNLAALCRHHHQLKQRPGWSVSQDERSTLTWTSPTGHTYATDPEPLPSADGEKPPTAPGPPF